MLKEQLRVKSLELKKRDIERTQHENKVQQVIEVSRKKISNLKQEIAEKDKSIRNASSVPIEGSQSKSIVDSTPNSLKEIKLSKGILALRQKNSILTDKLRAEKEKRENSAKEIDRLLEEIQRLQGNSEKTALLKKQLAEMEVEYQHFQKKYKKLLEEKKEILAEYQELQSDRINNRPEVNQELEDQLAFYKAEKGNLELELENNKKLFNKKLADKINKVEEEWRGKTKVLRRQKDRKKHFSGESMDEGEGPAWIITYSDMATLLLTFFILYYSIAAQNLGKFKDAILEESDKNLGLIELIESTKITTALQNFSGFKSNNILNDMKDFATDENNLGITENKSKIIIRIPGKTLFQPASAVLEKQGWPILTETAAIFKKYPNYKIHIQGHTDDDSVTTEKFPTNWELSATRATAVLRFFVDKGLDPIRLTATGYADTFPLHPNDTAEGRALNRRVEFVLEKITQ
ncbi:MAG: OmpA family protein [Nitrospinae bacterium]|nr:OmpA family protein [Nitrospinota bacterium]